MVLLGSLTFAWGQTAPSFRSNSQLKLNDPATGRAESSTPAGTQEELLGLLPSIGSMVPGMPALPVAKPRFPGTVQPVPGPAASMRVVGALTPGPVRTAQRPPGIPLTLQRHPGRNLEPPAGDGVFTFRTSSAADVLAQISAGMQIEIWHTDNLAFVKRSSAVSDVVMEVRPFLQLNLGSLPAGHDSGSPPVGRAADSLRTEHYLQLRYTPTFHTLLEAGTSRTLARVAGEIGRASPVLLTAVRFEHDEYVFGARGDSTAEESGTVTEVSPVIEYSLTAKSALRVEGTWRRIVTQSSGTNRSEYILDAWLATAMTPKTNIGTGLEFGHIPFDDAQFGAQDFEQAYVSTVWQPSPRVRFQTRAGVELRQFNQPVPKSARVTPVANVALNWSPSENTQVNAGFLVRTRPSVSRLGATFQEIRLGTDARHQIGRSLYVSGEIAFIQRSYDSGIREFETRLRPAFGFRTDRGRLFDAMNVELYYQFSRLDSNQPSADRDRNIFGIESTVYF